MAETTIIDLTNRVGKFSTVTAEWWEDNSKFVVVRGLTEGDCQSFALRLDLEKRAFIDRAPDPKTDQLLQGQALQISQLVWSERAKLLKVAQRGAA
ncbi:hypothetical protein ACQR1Y_02810 [Bradyrhizobium sp. HKCCYLRH3099]|uniref:hypothetical protein n=1 Tax=unclassified Bradyrhizobium TaxID=2631580 RepID=UPI003EB754FC